MTLAYIRDVRNSLGPADRRSIRQNTLADISDIAREGDCFRTLFYGKRNGAPEEIRTPDPQIRSLVLYPAELRVRWQ